MQLTVFKAAFIAALGGDIADYIKDLRDQAKMPDEDYLEAELDKAGLMALAGQLNANADKKVE